MSIESTAILLLQKLYLLKQTHLFASGDAETARLILRDLVNATIGFEELARAMPAPAKSRVPGVSQEAQNALERTLSIVSSDSLWQVFTTSSTWYAKRNALHLLNRINKWDRINYMLLAASQEDPRVRELAMEFIATWEIQYRATWRYTKPNQEQKEKFVSGMLLVGKVLPDQLGKTLELCLQACNER